MSEPEYDEWDAELDAVLEERLRLLEQGVTRTVSPEMPDSMTVEFEMNPGPGSMIPDYWNMHGPTPEKNLFRRVWNWLKEL